MSELPPPHPKRAPDVGSSSASASAALPSRSRADREISLLDIAISLAKHKRLVLGLPTALALVAAGISLLLPNIYTGTARILPPQQGQSAGATLLGHLGPIGVLAPGSLGLKNPNDLYVGMLSSRSIADSLIGSFGLRDLYGVDTLDEARRMLAQMTTISAGRDGIITIDVDDRDPERAAALANAYVEELEKVNEKIAVTEAGQRRLFFEKQLQHARDALADAEIALKETQEETGLIKLEDQGRAIIEAIAQLRSQIAAKEVQIGAMRSYATDANPALLHARRELGALHAQLRKMEGGSGTGSEVLVASGRVPEAGLQYLRKLRDVKYQEAVLEVLAKQYEVARLDEARDASLIQPLDVAVVPERKSKPRRSLIVVLAFLGGLLMSLLLLVVREVGDAMRHDPEETRRLAELQRHLRLRNPDA
jgi:tyrosine-protein kinase Etk/Wzc